MFWQYDWLTPLSPYERGQVEVQPRFHLVRDAAQASKTRFHLPNRRQASVESEQAECQPACPILAQKAKISAAALTFEDD